MVDEVLEMRGITKTFPGVKALDNVSLELRKNEILGLVGENGAGKSTLMKILIGLYPKDSGEILLRNEEINPKNVKQAFDYGISMVFQEPAVLPNIKVAENIFLGYEERFLRNGIIDWEKMYKEAGKQLEKLGIRAINPKAITGSIPFWQRQMIEIARAISLEDVVGEPVIILDEPTSSLSVDRVNLFEAIRKLKEKASFIFISHRLEEVLELTDRIVVLKNGKNAGLTTTNETDIKELHAIMIGREREEAYYSEDQQEACGDEVVLSLESLSGPYFKDVTLQLHKGEILGVGGVVGSGKSFLGRTLFGDLKVSGGRIVLNGKELNPKSASDAVKSDIAYVSRDRHEEGLIPYFRVKWNLTLTILERLLKNGLIDFRKEKETANELVSRLSILTPSVDSLSVNLSGGNQQKVVLGKWLARESKILVLDEPARGVDVGVKAEIYRLMRMLAKQGVSIVLISDELPELIEMSHRIITMKDGRISQVLEAARGQKPSEKEVFQYM